VKSSQLAAAGKLKEARQMLLPFSYFKNKVNKLVIRRFLEEEISNFISQGTSFFSPPSRWYWHGHRVEVLVKSSSSP